MRPSTLGGEGGWCASFQPLPLPVTAQRRLSITGSVSEVDTEIRPRFMLNEPLASLLTLFRLFPNPTARENRGPRTRPRGFVDAHPPSALGDPQLCPPGAATKQEADPPRDRDRGPREGGCKDDASAGDGNRCQIKIVTNPCACLSSVFKKTALNCISWSPISPNQKENDGPEGATRDSAGAARVPPAQTAGRSRARTARLALAPDSLPGWKRGRGQSTLGKQADCFRRYL